MRDAAPRLRAGDLFLSAIRVFFYEKLLQVLQKRVLFLVVPASKYLINEGGAKLQNNVRSERARLGLSQSEFASILDVDESTLRRWESDASSIKACHLKRMSELFKCTVDYLLGMSEERTVSRIKTG